MVTFETAVKLKEAGFPQPDPKIGQVWYFFQKPRMGILSDGTDGYEPFVVTHQDIGWRMVRLGKAASGYTLLGDAGVFAPTAAQTLATMRNGSMVAIMDGKFLCHPTDNDDPVDSPATRQSDNMDEACAQAWLENRYKNDRHIH